MDALTVITSIVGVVLLLEGADLLIRGAASIARKASVPPLIVGLTVVALGTSAPEIAIGIRASLAGSPDIAVGNVVGSNIFNILLVLGLSALIAPLVVQSQLVRIDVPVLIGITTAFLLLCRDGAISRLESVFLLAALALYIAFQIWVSRQNAHTEKLIDAAFEHQAEMQERWLVVSAAYIIGGLVMLVIGARWLVSGATEVARSLGVSELIISLTVVAAGTSLPEIATSVAAALRGERDIAVGNVVGSCILNLLAVIGIAGLVRSGGIPVANSLRSFDIPVMLAVTIACLPIFFTGRLIARWEGGLFLAYYVAYTAYLVLDASNHDALDGFSFVMAVFVIPLTCLTLVFLALRSFYHQRGTTDMQTT